MIPTNEVFSEYFKGHPQLAVALSGGADSSYLTYLTARYCAKTQAYFIRTPLVRDSDLFDAWKVCAKLDVKFTILELDPLKEELIAANGPERCYHCKRLVFNALLNLVRSDGFDELADGTNASDDGSTRPGMRALAELGVLSPLKELGLCKQDVREASAQAGLFTAHKPSSACLATRFPCNTRLTEAGLAVAARCEEQIAALGFSGFRVRCEGESARLELTAEDWPRAIELREKILAALQESFKHVCLDLKLRQNS